MNPIFLKLLMDFAKVGIALFDFFVAYLILFQKDKKTVDWVMIAFAVIATLAVIVWTNKIPMPLLHWD